MEEGENGEAVEEMEAALEAKEARVVQVCTQNHGGFESGCGRCLDIQLEESPSTSMTHS